MSFTDHIDSQIAKARSMLGFVFRFTFEFKDPHTLRIIYQSLVRSILEFASVIWSPFYKVHCKRIESIQKRFLIFALRQFNWGPGFSLPSYESRCKLLDIDSLESRRNMSSLMFMTDVITGRLDSPSIYNKLSFNINNKNLRNHRMFEPDCHKTNYAKYEPINRMMLLLNRCKCFDQNLPRQSYKSLIRSHNCLN